MKKYIMNMSIKNLSLALGVVALSSVAFGQKNIETSAAVEYKNKYLPALMKQDIEGAKKALRAARGFIDQAAVHPDTENSQKTLWLKGEIYYAYLTVGMMSQDTAFIKEAGEDAIEQSIAAYKKGYPLGKKYKRDIETGVDQKVNQMNGMAGMLYQAEQYAEAAEVYETMVKYNETIEYMDTTSIFNSSLCYEKAEKFEKAAEGYEKLANVGYKGIESAVDASRAYRKAGNLDKAMAIINKAREADPTNRELLLELVNANIEAGDAAGAQKALNDAIATDPENKALHYTIGTIYIDLKENGKAEEALNKALEIDPDYADAQYQLGAHLVTWAGDLKDEANALKFGDPNYNKLIAESEGIYKRAVVPLEKYIGNYPNDKAVLNILFQLHRNLGNSEKAIEYKKRHEGIE
jgi:tetratricopeptide (TPR) repeat protein